jgi:hypothetical protein
LALWTGSAVLRHGWAASGLLLAAAALVCLPWLARNRQVSGHALGLAPYAALTESAEYPDLSLERSAAPSIHRVRAWRAVRQKIRANVSVLLDRQFGLLGAGLAGAFFIVSLFVPSDERETGHLRWLVVLGFVLLNLMVAAAGRGQIPALAILYPVVILFGCAFLFATLEQRGLTGALGVGVLVALAATPPALKMSGPPAAYPYPPYYPALNAGVAAMLAEDETLATDVPWATAWYGKRTSLLLPRGVPDLEAIQAKGGKLGGIYFANRARSEAAADAWSVVRAGSAPPGFPFQHALHVPPGTRDQVFVSDRVRWE